MTTVEISTPHASHQVLEEKLTSLALYLTAREAYEMWQADPERIKVLDVRTFEEYVLIGHAEMAANVPLAFPTYNWDANKGNYSVVVNKDFIESKQLPDVFSLEKDILEKEAGSSTLKCMIFDDLFIDIGIPDDYRRAESILKIV